MVHNSAEHVMRNLASCKCNEETILIIHGQKIFKFQNPVRNPPLGASRPPLHALQTSTHHNAANISLSLVRGVVGCLTDNIE